MNWKFWKSKSGPIQQWNKPVAYTLSEEELAFVAGALAPAFKRVPDIEPLTDYQKAARLEYRYLQAMARPKKAESALEALGREAMRQNAWAYQQLQGDRARYQDLRGGYCQCLGNGTCIICAMQRQNMEGQMYIRNRLGGQC